MRRDLKFSMAQLFPENAELVQSALAALDLFGRRDGGSSRGFGRVSGWPEPHAADVEVFLKPVELEEVGDFERPDIAPCESDFLLQVSNDLGQIGRSEAGAEELIPKPLPVKTQGEVLTGELAIGLVQLLDLIGQGLS
jgi:hypothetical protein